MKSGVRWLISVGGILDEDSEEILDTRSTSDIHDERVRGVFAQKRLESSSQIATSQCGRTGFQLVPPGLVSTSDLRRSE